ncbi:hypothetical protein VNI00_009686 [Paramarasmius palmivorus]|uniref:Uncharacterized protein n=1 Tax=Paramarasmius palmivorus TaxID=297713 RepID=A0AAW0CLV1_9AGAR
MFVPFITLTTARAKTKNRLSPRAGRRGGGGSSESSGESSSSSGGTSLPGGGIGGSSSGSGPSSGSDNTNSTYESDEELSKKITTPIVVTGGTYRLASPFSSGGGPVLTVPGQLFGGRQQGGGTRDQVYGTSVYGSGYPNISERGVAGRGFPFYFWPIAWSAGVDEESYLRSQEYGKVDNTSRPGGPLVQATFTSNTMGDTFRVVMDNATASSLIPRLWAFCLEWLVPPVNTTSTTSLAASYPSVLPTPSLLGDIPQPENVIQYYRASSVALTLDRYNNTAAFSNNGDVNLAPAPLPLGMDRTLMDCLNKTIGEVVLLINRNGAPASGLDVEIGQVVFILLIFKVFLRF